MCESHTRAQTSLSVIEAGIGVVLVLAVAMGFVVDLPAPDTRDTQLETYAEDAVTVLESEPPRHGGATRLSEVARSPQSFERERAALARRVDRILPDNLLYRVETPHGSVGFQRPRAVAVGTATSPTQYGTVVVRVWYA